MCGIAGWIDARRMMEPDAARALLAEMSATLVHRGPDDAGQWLDPAARVALGHQRLSIIDLTASGHQPMVSRSGRWILTYNGEVYNHGELRARLVAAGSSFRGHSDTEVIVEAIDRWGLAAAAAELIGMFAFAAWDRVERKLVLVRDRVGIKPLYYAQCGSTFLFGSELKALRRHPAFRPRLHRGAVALYLQHGYIPAPYSIYEGVFKLPPGTILEVVADGEVRKSSQVFWSLKDVVERGRTVRFVQGEAEAEEQLDALIRDAVERRMVADVPVGAFLSGGIDSSTVVGHMQAASARPVRTFAIGFSEGEFNEAPYAREVARHLGTEHLEFIVRPEEARDVIPQLAGQYDEPFGDSSAIPTFLVSRLTRQHVKVCLSGDGGDELFGGYQRYAFIEAAFRQVRGWPGWMRAAAAVVVPRLPWRYVSKRWERRARTLVDLMRMRTPQEMYGLLHTHWRHPHGVLKDCPLPPTLFHQPTDWPETEDAIASMMFIDGMTYLPDDVLTKVDRASMAVGLEARVPLLDHRVIEFAWRLPMSFKRQGEQTKRILQRVLARYVPPSMFERKKAGFSIPIGAWLRGPLRDWAENLLSESRLEAGGLLRTAAVRRKWHEHLAGSSDWSPLLWDVLMLHDWLDQTPL